MQEKEQMAGEERFSHPFKEKALKELRLKIGYRTQAEFAEASGIGGRAFVNRLENGSADLSPEVLLKLVVYIDCYLSRRPEMWPLIRRCIQNNLKDPADAELFQYPTLLECWTRHCGLKLPQKPDLEQMALMPYQFFLDAETLPPQAYDVLRGVEQKMEEYNDHQSPSRYQAVQWRQFFVPSYQYDALERAPKKNEAVLARLTRLRNNGLLDFYEIKMPDGKTEDLLLPELLARYQGNRLSGWTPSLNSPPALLTGTEERAREVVALNYNCNWVLAQSIRVLLYKQGEGFIEWQPETEHAEQKAGG